MDAQSGDTYYFHAASGKTSWDKPAFVAVATAATTPVPAPSLLFLLF